MTALGGLLFYGITVQGRNAFYSPVDIFHALTYSLSDTVPVSPVKKTSSTPVLQTRATETPTGKILLNDTIPPKKDSVAVADSLQLRDSMVQKIDTFDLKMSKDTIDAPVDFEAEDSMVVDIPGKQIFLYNKASVKFKDVALDAAVIRLDQPTQILTAYSIKDSAGLPTGVPAFKQGESAFTSDTIRYNFKTQRGLTIGTYTQEGEMYIYGEKVKRISPTVFFAEKARFTSCNYDTPHFAFKARKVKFISNQVAVTGLVRPEFENVPIPIGLPFGLFPMKQGRRTGLLPPQPTVNEQLGFGLEGLGYYKTFGELWDATIRANIYSYGSYNLFLTPTYRKRYRYSGGFNLSYMNNKFGFKGDPDYSPPSRNFSVQWNHSLDGKARPGQTFSANVNVATSLFNRLFPNNAQQNFNNTLQSSIAYQRTWAGKPYNLTVSANHNQNTNTKLFNVSLPDVGFTVNTIYPFQKKDFVGTPKWYEKLGVSYNGTFRNQFAFYDTAFSFKQLIDTFDWSARHSIPIQLSLPPLGPLQVGPSISYDETWHSRTFIRQWNPATKTVETIGQKGFYTERQMSFGLNFSTALFGTMNFKKGNVKALRHVIRPTFGMGYRPDLNRAKWYLAQVDSTGRQLWFDKFNGSQVANIPDGRSGSINFSIDNNLELKVKDKKDTSAAADKKIRLIDGFGMSTSYNMLADSFGLSDFNFYLRSNLFEKISLTAGANVSPYQIDQETGFRKQQYAWQADKFSLGRFSSGFVSVSTQFKSKPKDEKKQKEKEDMERNRRNDFDEQGRELNAIQNNPGEFVDFNVPWSLNLSYSLNLTRMLKRDYSGFETMVTQSINFNGDFNLTEKWKVQANGTFDMQTRTLQYLTTSISRDLHCWQLAINVTPIGPIRSFNISISPKSGLLRDLRINRSRMFYANLPQF
ncbi:putative LPS assembly protein LptD [Lacibacter sp. H407]|uniref:putative LPS assembly protein LptD n=1 Tax=Lacibacter sp. H407 TaxID=3133423 RepID=UPI0030BA97D6